MPPLPLAFQQRQRWMITRTSHQRWMVALMMESSARPTSCHIRSLCSNYYNANCRNNPIKSQSLYPISYSGQGRHRGVVLWSSSHLKDSFALPTTSCVIRRPLVSSTLPSTSSTVTTSTSTARTASDTAVSVGPVTRNLQDKIQTGEIQPDIHQARAALELDRLYQELCNHPPPPSYNTTTHSNDTKHETSTSSFFGSWFGSSQTNNTASSTNVNPFFSMGRNHQIPGIYMYGGVGCGKTFLMNIFYDAIQSNPQHPWYHQKQKSHYHKFMLDVHQVMHEVRKLRHTQSPPKVTQEDLLVPVIERILQRGRLLCLDEFQVTDVGDAMILQRLFEGLWNKGCVVVATSNRPPQDLYLHGLQRDRFLPFIASLQRYCHVVSMKDSDIDYRMMLSSVETKDNVKKSRQVYFTKSEKPAMEALFYQLTEASPAQSMYLETQGRKVAIPQGTSSGIAKFTFEDLCQKALGAADYLVIGQHFHTVFVSAIPPLTINEINWLRRFITFVDTMYELQVTLVLQTSSKRSILDIFQLDDAKETYGHIDEVFAFDRTRSRLEEMSSQSYLSKPWLGRSGSSSDGKQPSMSKQAVVTKTLHFHPSLADDKVGQE